MARTKKNPRIAEDTAATVGYEAQLWQMADALRGSMDAAEYKHVVHHLAPAGVAGFVVANGSMSSNDLGELPRSADRAVRIEPCL